MAGTRLLVQGVALFELIVLTIWSLYYGLCRQGDKLCNIDINDEIQLPSLECPHSLPLIQTDHELRSDLGLDCKTNANAAMVCTQPESSMIQDEIIWRCPNDHPDDPPRIVVRKSSTMIYSSEPQLAAVATPKTVPPFPLHVRVVLEETDNLAEKALPLASSLEKHIQDLQYWPCVSQLHVEMIFADEMTREWMLVAEDTSSDNDGSAPSYLPKITAEQAQFLYKKLNLSRTSSNAQDLVLFVPSQTPEAASNFEVGATTLLMVGQEFDASVIHQWLQGKIGISSEALDADKSFSTWYNEWYWYSASQKLSNEVVSKFEQVKHLVKEPLELKESASIREHYDSLVQLEQAMDFLLTSSGMQPDFPIEHYAAIFAPLLFPLFLPFLVGTIKEIKRYKEKQQKKREKEATKEKMD